MSRAKLEKAVEECEWRMLSAHTETDAGYAAYNRLAVLRERLVSALDKPTEVR